MQTCRQCKKLLRADHVDDMLRESEWVQSLAEIFTDVGFDDLLAFNGAKILQWARGKGRKLAPGLAVVRNPTVTLSWLAEDVAKASLKITDVGMLLCYLATEQKNVTGLQKPCPYCGGDLTEPRPFNLMFESHAGVTQTEENKVYLRPETAQGIFLNFKAVLDSCRVRPPFGIAQVGKSFRNEVTPRNFIFRSREFEQMEMEFFCPPETSAEWHEFWIKARYDWWLAQGLSAANLQRRDHDKDELSHYSSATADIEYRYPFTAPDYGELEGVAHRGDFDLTQHQTHSKTKLDYFDQEANRHYLPHVIEPAAGLTRGVLALLCEAYQYDESRASPEWLKLKPSLAPVKLGIFPLVNKEGMPEVAEKLFAELRQKHIAQFDAKQAIGKRYARMDEIGAPYCITVDGDTLTGGQVTVRDRDTAQQERVDMTKLSAYFAEKLG